MEGYPMVGLIVRHGRLLAAVIAALLPLGALVLVAAGSSWLALPLGLVLGAIAYGLLLSYVEIVRIISDTLLPK